MPHAAEISRAAPSCFLFVVDQSGSMEDAFAGAESSRSKAQELADVINRLLQTLVTRCAQGEDVHDYFEIGVIGYGETVGPALQGPLAGRDLVKISELAFNPALLEQRTRTIPDGDGGTIEESYQFPVWVDPIHVGGTPMCEALRRTKTALEAWVVAHPQSYPPTVVHITDGESTDGEPFAIASSIRALATNDGPVSLFNLHLSSSAAKPVTFPSAESDLPDEFARTLFDMSSLLPARVRHEAGFEGYPVNDSSRGFAFNADLIEAIRFIDIGTRVSGRRS
jgi:hypothetical protein